VSAKQAVPPQEGHSRLETEVTNRVFGWVIAAVVACVAGLGLIVFALLAVVGINLIAEINDADFDLPGWAIQLGGIALVLATAAFAWLVATAVERSRNSSKESRGPTRIE
jgi:membrane protein implicated in regulation of membrane protease activity